MIPASYHFQDITRSAPMHPGVEAEIAEARRRDGIESKSQPWRLATVLRRLLPVWQPKRDWSRVPAE